MKKAIILGSPGAGKTTFAKKLQSLTNLPLYHLDLIWHKPDKTHVTREEFDKRLQDIISKDNWIIDGNYFRTHEIRIAACDTVFLLDFPVEVCLEGAKQRIGIKRPDLPWLEETFDEEFKQWIIDFPSAQLPQIYQTLKKYEDTKEIIIFRSRSEIEQYLNDFKM